MMNPRKKKICILFHLQLGQGLGTYWLSRAAWIVQYRWRTAKIN